MLASRLRDSRGSAVVEFAVCSALYFTLVFAIVEGSRAIYHYNIIASVAREGTRFAAVRGAGSGRVVSEADVRTYVQSRSLGLNPTVTVTWTPTSKAAGSTVQVTVTHTFTTLVHLSRVGTISMSSTARGIVVD